MNRLNLTRLRQMKTEQNKIAMLTAYDASFSHVLEQYGDTRSGKYASCYG
jgi:3-methyl-2-oxobutanoate hydroxymethyltransferase